MRFRFKVILAAAALFAAGAAQAGAEVRLRPSLVMSEEYNDNIFATERNRDEDYITRLLPGFEAAYAAARLDASVSYFYDYRYFAKQRSNNIETHKLKAESRAELVENTFFLKLSDNYDRVSTDPTVEKTNESLFLSQTDANFFVAEPYLTLRPYGRIELTAGYRYLNVWYKEPGSVDKKDHTFYLKAGSELSEFTSWNLYGEHMEEKSMAADFKRDSASAGFVHKYGEESFVSASIGGSRLDFDAGKTYSSLFWNASITQALGLFKGVFATSARMNENPQSTPQWEYSYSAALSRALSRSSYKVSVYLTDYKNSETEALETRKYGTALNFDHKFSENAQYVLSATAEKFEKRTIHAYTNRLYVDQAIKYSFSKGLSASLGYILVGYHSPQVAEDNYITNRFIAEFSKTF